MEVIIKAVNFYDWNQQTMALLTLWILIKNYKVNIYFKIPIF